MFNVRVKTFYDTEQIQIFSKPQHEKGEVIRRRIDHETGEIFPQERPNHNIFVEFTDGTTFSGSELTEHNEEESLRVSCSRTVKKIYDIARSNPWEWFITLTFNGDKVNRYDYSMVSKKLSDWLKNMRKKCPDMIYLVVPEQHKDGAYHFHGLFMNINELDFSDSGKVDKHDRVIYNLLSYKWGFTTATKVTDFRKASGYLCKYITKDLCAMTKGRKRYWASRNVALPVVQEMMVDPEYLNLTMVAYMQEDAFVKSVEGAFTSVKYIDQSIPQIHVLRID